MLKIVAAFAATISLAAAAVAADKNATADPVDAPKKEKKLCRAQVATGSIMEKRICHTRSEWDAIDRQNNANAQNALDYVNRNQGPAVTR